MYNNADYFILILKYYWLGFVTKLSYKSCFTILVNFDIIFMPLISSTIFYQYNSISILLAKNLEIEFQNGIKIYKDKKIVKAITCFANE